MSYAQTMKVPEVKNQRIDDITLKYLEYHANKPVLLLLHANGFSPWLWHPIAQELQNDYRIIAPYLCEHRDAEPHKGLEWIQLSEDLFKFCKTLNLENPLCVGHSMGATVVMLAEAVFGPFAHKMILIEPIFLPEELYGMPISIEQHPLAAKALKRRNFWKNREEARMYLRSKKLFEKWTEEMLDLYIAFGMVEEKDGGLSLACSPHKEAALFMGGVKYNPWPLMPKVTCPVLILEGEESENRLFIDLKKATSMFSNADHKIIKGAGHLIPMEKPNVIVEIIKGTSKN